MFRPEILSASRELLYESYEFKRTTFKVYKDGDTIRVPSDTVENILVAKDWQRYKNGGFARGGYIAKGWLKYAFHVSTL